jgi:hypothetical protein
LFLILQSIVLQNLVNFGEKKGGFHNLQIWVSLEK